MKRVLIMSMTRTSGDPRVMRQIEALKGVAELTIVGLDGSWAGQENYFLVKDKRTPLHEILRALRAHGWYNTLRYRLVRPLGQLRRVPFDSILANDLETLPMAFKVSKGTVARVVFDAHEYYPKHFTSGLLWNFLVRPYNEALCRKYLPKVDSMSTVSLGLAEEYRRNFARSPEIITNASAFRELVPTPVVPNRIRLVHHGMAQPNRHLELMVAALGLLDERFSLDLYLAGGSTKYLNKLETLAQADPRVHIRPPVELFAIPETLNQYDLGLCVFPPVTFNLLHALPNKLFEFVQARLGLVVGPGPEMAQMTLENKLGIVLTDFTAESLAEALNSLTSEDVSAFKHQAHKLARDLCAEANYPKIRALLEVVK